MCRLELRAKRKQKFPRKQTSSIQYYRLDDKPMTGRRPQKRDRERKKGGKKDRRGHGLTTTQRKVSERTRGGRRNMGAEAGEGTGGGGKGKGGGWSQTPHSKGVCASRVALGQALRACNSQRLSRVNM